MPSIVSAMKAIKNPTELKGFHHAHVQDGVALVRFIFHLEKFLNSGQAITETMAAEELGKFRKQGEHYVGPSFKTISASGPNAAIIHYKPPTDGSRLLSLNELYLCDSGGQYLYTSLS